MTRELAWKPRWAVIMFVNVWARSTLDISIAPAVVEAACRRCRACSTCAAPELADSIQRLPDARSRPAAFWNVASDR